LDSATMVYSRNTTEYNYYGGIDLEPRHDPWPEDGARRLLSDGTGVDFKDAAEKHRLVPGETGSLLVGECTAPSSRGGTWHVQRVGPLTSVGGYDWHAGSWIDPGFVSGAIAKGGGVAGVLAHFTGAVDATGSHALSYPPIHQHHTHIVPAPTDVFILPMSGWSSNRLIQVHGDWDFSSEGSTGLQAMGQHYRGRVKLLNERPSINFELNDVRALGSPPLTYYYQVAMLIGTGEQIDTSPVISFHKTHNAPGPPPTGLVLGGQTAAVALFASPITQDAHAYYSGLWPIDSRLLSATWHSHAAVQQFSFLFSASAPQLGLGPEVSNLDTSEVGFDSIVGEANTAVRMRVLAKAAPLEALVCWSESQMEVVEGLPNTTSGGPCYDRASYPTCYEKQWAKGEMYTVLTLTGPTSCGYGHEKPSSEYAGPPGTLPNHAIWFIQHAATGEERGTSVYTYMEHAPYIAAIPTTAAAVAKREEMGAASPQPSPSRSAIASASGREGWQARPEKSAGVASAPRASLRGALSLLQTSSAAFARGDAAAAAATDASVFNAMSLKLHPLKLGAFLLPGLAAGGTFLVVRRVRRRWQYEAVRV